MRGPKDENSTGSGTTMLCPKHKNISNRISQITLRKAGSCTKQVGKGGAGCHQFHTVQLRGGAASVLCML